VAVDGDVEVEALGAQELDQTVADRGLVLDDQGCLGGHVGRVADPAVGDEGGAVRAA
jgi:hypothetical protein